DIIKAIQLLPGVAAVGEGGSGFYVRGGNADQNLILLDEAPIYNASHLLGFFSSFNPEAIKDMQLYKGAMPAYYGGRLSSVLDIRMKEGNAKRFTASGGLGTVMSRIAIEAPITEKGSFMIAGRRSYLDVLAKGVQRVRTGEKLNTTFYFYDLNAKTNYRINENNRVFASGYFGRDVFKFPDDGFNVDWGNTTATLRWNHIFSPKLFSNLTYYYSKYDYFLGITDDISEFTWDSRLKEHSVKADFGAFINPSNTLRFGLHTIQHNIFPGDIQSLERDSLISEFMTEKKTAYESAFYVNNTQTINDRIKIDYGLRVSALHNVGPEKVYSQDENYEITDTIEHKKGIYNSYWNLEPRIGLRFSLNKTSSLKASYNRTAQYIQQASNGNSATPFDIWFLSSEIIKPQLADQYSIGYFKNLNNNTIELSAEIYYKNLINTVDFKEHAQLLLNENLDGEIRTGKGRAYGIELLAKKDKGRLTGWVGYTYSRSEKKIETINNGNWYNAKQDKPHDISIVAAYEINDLFSVSGNFVYSTGSAVTFPTGRYVYKGVSVPVYSERNGSRLPDYHRMDLSTSFKPRKNKNRRWQSEWVVSVYNVYNRKNAFSIDFRSEEFDANQTYAEKSAVFSIVPSFTYNVKF
ncbi:MAG: TonB-dependent receptor plug domain-containing protein, partial [Saprospiraceae bacterium]